MNFVGSKKTLLPFLLKNINECNLPEGAKILDLFAGTGVVANNLKGRYAIWANDFMYFCWVLNYAQLTAGTNLSKEIVHLNSIPPSFDDKFYIEYGKYRFYFKNNNAGLIASIRRAIEELYCTEEIDYQEYIVLIATLLRAADKVANTASVYDAYLKHIKKSALKPLKLELMPTELPSYAVEVTNKEAVELLDSNPGWFDLVYIDPPYNQRQYSSMYHIIETIARWDLHTFEPRGKTGQRPPYNKSKFSSKRYVYSAMEELLRKVSIRTKYVVLSYSSEGIIPFSVLVDLMERYFDNVHVDNKTYPKFKSQKNNSKKMVTEFCFVGESK